MAARSSTLSIRVDVEAGNAARQLDQVGDKAEGFGDKMSKVAGAAVAFAAVGAFVSKAAEAASKLQQSSGGVEAVFKSSASQVKEWGKQAASTLGLAQSEYQDLATLIGAQLKNAGTAMDDLAPATNRLIEQGADLAAMYGGTTAEAVAALSSALKGEMDPVEKYGIALNDAAIQAEIAAQGLDTSTAAAKAAAKQQAVLALVTKQGADAWGAAAREQDSYASVMQQLSAVWENTMAEIGTALLPALSGLAKAFTDMAPAIGTILTPLAELVGLVLSLPGPVLGVAAAIGGWAIFGGSILSALSSFNTKMQATTGSMAGFKSGLASIGRLAAGGLALAAIGFAITEIVGAFAEAERATEAYDSTVTSLGAQLYSLAASGEATVGALDSLKEEAAQNSEGFKNLIAAGASVSAALDVVKNGSSASAQSMAEVEKAMSGMGSEAFMATSQYLNMGAAAQKIADGKAEYVASEKAKAAATGEANASTEAATAASKEAAEAQAKQAEEQRKAAMEAAQAAASQTAVKVALDGVKDAASAASTAVEFYVLQMNLANGISVTTDQAAKLLNDSMRSMGDAFRASAEAGGINTEALTSWNVAALTSTKEGSALYDSLTQAQTAYATSTTAAYQNAAANGDTAAGMVAAAGAADTARAAFLQSAMSAGVTEEAANALATKLGLVEGTKINPKTFELIANDQQADAAVAELQAAEIEAKVVTVTGEVGAAVSAFGGLKGEKLANTVKVDADPKAAQSTINGVVNEKRTTTPVNVTADPSQANSTINALTQTQRSTQVQVTANASPALQTIGNVVNSHFTATITVNANTGPAQSAINAIVNGSYNATVNVTANTAAARAAIASVPTVVAAAAAPQAMQQMMAGPMAFSAFAAPAPVAAYPPLHGVSAAAAPVTEINYHISVSGGLDSADSIARRIEQTMERRERRIHGVTVRPS